MPRLRDDRKRVLIWLLGGELPGTRLVHPVVVPEVEVYLYVLEVQEFGLEWENRRGAVQSEQAVKALLRAVWLLGDIPIVLDNHLELLVSQLHALAEVHLNEQARRKQRVVQDISDCVLIFEYFACYFVPELVQQPVPLNGGKINLGDPYRGDEQQFDDVVGIFFQVAPSNVSAEGVAGQIEPVQVLTYSPLFDRVHEKVDHLLRIGELELGPRREPHAQEVHAVHAEILLDVA